eukprot:SAG11_NODE_32520_length_282_cov_42.469945_1_plen_56_part_10
MRSTKYHVTVSLEGREQYTRLLHTHGLDIVVIRTVVPYYEYHDIRRDTIESTRKVE